MIDQQYNVLFLCTGNSARSIMAEAILNGMDAGFRAYSAGSHPKGRILPETLRLLKDRGHGVLGLRSKSWVEFLGPGALQFDFVITVCDAASEACPIWPGQPMMAHWGVADPAAAGGSAAEIASAFEAAYRLLNQRIQAFTALPLPSLDEVALAGRLAEIGRMSA